MAKIHNMSSTTIVNEQDEVIGYKNRNAIVPAVGFLLSTLTLPIFKKLWLQQYGE